MQIKQYSHGQLIQLHLLQQQDMLIAQIHPKRMPIDYLEIY